MPMQFGETLRCARASPNGARGREQLAALAPFASAELLTGADTAPRPGPVLVAQACGLPTARRVPLTSRPIGRHACLALLTISQPGGERILATSAWLP